MHNFARFEPRTYEMNKQCNTCEFQSIADPDHPLFYMPRCCFPNPKHGGAWAEIDINNMPNDLDNGKPCKQFAARGDVK